MTTTHRLSHASEPHRPVRTTPRQDETPLEGRPTRRALLSATGVAGVLAASGCSYLNGNTGGDEGVKLTFRIWSDDAVAAAYKKSFDAFTAKNPGITVAIEQIPWDSYFDTLRTDIAAGSVADAFWINAYNFATYADNGDLVNVTKTLPKASSGWEQSAVDLYTRKDSLWGVPQLIDGAKVLFINKKLLAKADVNAQDLAWDPTAQNDSLREAARALTLDKSGKTASDPGFKPATVTQYGFNAGYDFDAIIGNFVGSNGGLYQEDGVYVFADNPRAVQAIEYVVDLVTTEHVAPSASDTNADGSFSLTQFQAGKLALFESGAYNLSAIAQNADFDWALAPIPTGPKGRIPVTNSIIAAGSAASKHPKELATLLTWLGSEEGSAPLGEAGAIIPAVTKAQQGYQDYWKSKGVDVKIFTEGLEQGVLRNDPIPNAQAATADLDSAFHEIFAGRAANVGKALKDAQTHANEQIKG